MASLSTPEPSIPDMDHADMARVVLFFGVNRGGTPIDGAVPPWVLKPAPEAAGSRDKEDNQSARPPPLVFSCCASFVCRSWTTTAIQRFVLLLPVPPTQFDDEATQGMSVVLHDCAPAVTLSELWSNEMRPEVGKGERKRHTSSASCANSSKQLIRDCASVLLARTAEDLPWILRAGTTNKRLE